MSLPDLSNVMPFHIGITLFLAFFASTMGIYVAKGFAHCAGILFHAAEEAFTPDDVPEVELDALWHGATEPRRQ